MELSFVQFDLRECRNQYDGKVYNGVINNVADEQPKLGTKYTVPQIAYYKSIALSEIGSQSRGGPSNVPPAFRNFSLAQKEKTEEEFVQY